MPNPQNVTTLVEGRRVTIPAKLRRKLGLQPGQQLQWQQVSDRELRVVVLDRKGGKGAQAMLAFARRFREVRSTAEWMAEIRDAP